jgi:dienelactone hydrolase
MLFLIPAAVLTLATLLIVALWRLVLAFRRRPAPRYWRRTFAWHLGLFAFHLFVTAPLGIGYLASRFVGTRDDEAGYQGPRIGADGAWQMQTRKTLASERQVAAEGAVAPAGASSAMWLTASDGVKLRSFLVPPRPEGGAGSRPRFVAVLVHGLYRGALEIETPGTMLRDLGGEVLLLELRNHGGSGRSKPTFGLDESLDVRAAVEFLRARPEAEGRPLVIYAISMGTAAAALAAPQTPDLAGLVLDAPMDDLAATTDRMLGGGEGGIPQPWRSTLVWSAEHLGRIPFDRVKPRDALARLSPDVAVLFVGAGKDDRMPADSVRALFDALPTRADRKELWIEPEATHGKVWVAAPDEYRRRLARFMDRVAPGREDTHPALHAALSSDAR